jgi:hypothetical protein
MVYFCLSFLPFPTSGCLLCPDSTSTSLPTVGWISTVRITALFGEPSYYGDASAFPLFIRTLLELLQ